VEEVCRKMESQKQTFYKVEAAVGGHGDVELTTEANSKTRRG
jgi:hypothetical protein